MHQKTLKQVNAKQQRTSMIATQFLVIVLLALLWRRAVANVTVARQALADALGLSPSDVQPDQDSDYFLSSKCNNANPTLPTEIGQLVRHAFRHGPRGRPTSVVRLEKVLCSQRCRRRMQNCFISETVDFKAQFLRKLGEQKMALHRHAPAHLSVSPPASES